MAQSDQRGSTPLKQELRELPNDAGVTREGDMKHADAEVEKHFCNTCQRLTRHSRRAVYSKTYVLDDDFDIQETWAIWECLGCETTLAIDSWMDDEPTYYPPRSSGQAEKKEYENIPSQLDSIYAEIVQAFNNGSHILCAAGLRALLEAICVDRDPSLAGPKKRLPQKIDTLKSNVPDKIVDNLHSFRFLGGRALHELERPQPKELALAIEVIEDVLNVVYELDYKSGRLYKLASGERKAHAPES